MALKNSFFIAKPNLNLKFNNILTVNSLKYTCIYKYKDNTNTQDLHNKVIWKIKPN